MLGRSCGRMVGLIALWTAASVARAAEPLCPAGEITLGPGVLRSRGDVRGDVSSSGATFVLPAGVAIDPRAEEVVFALEGDRQPIGQIVLQAGSLKKRGSKGFRYRHRRSRLSLRSVHGVYRLKARLRGFDLAALDRTHPPKFVKQVLKIGDDCFAAVLVCTMTKHQTLVCGAERTVLLGGHVERADHGPLAGTMLTLFDDLRLETVSVFAQEDGRYAFPLVRPGLYRLRARLVGYDDVVDTAVFLEADPVTRDFTLTPTANTNDQLPASAWFSLLLDKWPDPRIRGDFTLACGNCHQIGAYRFRRAKSEEEWRADLADMMLRVPPYFQETRDRLIDTVVDTYGPDATIPTLPLPPPPSGDALKAIIYEYVIVGTATSSPGCHDLELGADNRVYADDGLRWIDPRTGERGVYPFTGDSHSIERGPDGNMWITQAGSDSMAEVFVDGVTPPRYFPLPVIDGVQGAYPHTHRVGADGRMWMTLTKSNQLGFFDPATVTWAYYALPEADPAEVGLSIPIAYGCDVAPDHTVWWSQLFGQRIGRYDPARDTMKAWRSPFWGPRRLAAGADGIIWVPVYGHGSLDRFDPAIERWKSYPLPTGVAGPSGYGTSEAPYNLNVNRRDGFVWVNGSNSDTLVRFDPATERFTVFPLPTRASFTREIEFDPDNNVWTCTSNEPPGPDEPGRGKFVKIELPPPDAECGNHRLEAGEECDDGNTVDCDGCTAHCRSEHGCGDGAGCGEEACDDGNTADCDGCSSTCRVETGLLCGDGATNDACGEQCDPPVPGQCDAECRRIARCGDSIVDPGEECDDGPLNGSPDHCASNCTVARCGNGALDPGEECEDGNTADCDGCSSACTSESGWRCGDEATNAACGEECDPPGPGSPECNYLCRLGPAAPLGTRHFVFGGALYSSALGTGVALGIPEGSFDLVGAAPEVDGSASVIVGGPTYFRVPILGGSFGYLCGRLASCNGQVLCNGGAPDDVLVEQDSAGPGVQGNPVVATLVSPGPEAGPGSVVLFCEMATQQVNPPAPDCATIVYPPDQPTVFTTGSLTARFLDAHATIGSGEISSAGDDFLCAEWSSAPGPGALVGAFLTEEAPQAGDTANILRLSE